MSMLNHCTLAECLPGYHGPLCNMACRYPNYGEECQLQCLCEEEKCDHITGCVLKSNVWLVLFGEKYAFLVGYDRIQYAWKRW